MNSKIRKTGKNIIMSLALPVLVYLLFFIICNATGNSGFGVGADLKTIMYTSVYSGLIALAMTMNLTSGRFDFSVGATMVLAIIIGGNVAKEYDLGAAGLLIVTVLIGALIGVVSGLVYVMLKLPPMVISLGLAMIYEAFGFIFNKAKGVKLIGKNDMLIFARAPGSIVVIVAVLVILILLWDYTRFGYNRKAIATGQKIATDVGIDEKRNAFTCYVIAGALLGIAGCVYISKFGTVSPETGLSSASYFMTGFLPLFIGGAIGKYSSQPLGVFIGAITQAIITSGFTWLGFSSSLMTVLNGVIVMGFLIYTSNSYIFIERKMFKEKLEKAKQARA